MEIMSIEKFAKSLHTDDSKLFKTLRLITNLEDLSAYLLRWVYWNYWA